MAAKNLTMREVAKHAGVSQATVSLCLSNSPLANAKTKERILALARKIGYRTNPLVAAHMRTRRRRVSRQVHPVLAVINTQDSRLGWRKAQAQILPQMWRGVQQRIVERGYQLEEFWLYEPGVSQARLSEIIRWRGIRGVILGPSGGTHLKLEMDLTDLSCVRLGSGDVSVPLHRVTNSQYHTSKLAVEACATAGYRKPGLVVRRELNRWHEYQWEAGFDIACKHLAGVRPVPILFIAYTDYADDFDAWFRKHRPDVVIDVSEDDMLVRLRQLGYRVPEDVGVVTLCSPTIGCPLSGTVQDGAEVGARSVDLLIHLVEHNEVGLPQRPLTQSTVPLWNPGKTLRTVADAGRG